VKRLSFSVVVLVALLGVPSAASATPGHFIFHGPRRNPTSSACPTTSCSGNWSGYAAETSLTSPQTGVVTDVVGKWTVPAATNCGSTNGWSSNWVGIDGDTTNTVEQTGTDSDCQNGHPFYYAWYEMYPKGTVVIQPLSSVTAGDSVAAEVRYTGSGNYLLSLTINGQNFQTTQSSNRAKRASAEWIMEGPSNGYLPDFGTTTFTGAAATINGHTGPVNNSAWTDDVITMTDSKGQVKAQPGSITDSAGTSTFNVTWKQST
jgi:Peptidase A4 family